MIHDQYIPMTHTAHQYYRTHTITPYTKRAHAHQYVSGFEKGPLVAMYKVSLWTKTCKLSDVLSELRFLHLLYLWYRPNTLAKLQTRSPFLCFKPGRILRRRHVYGYNNGSVTGCFLIIATSVCSYFERAYLRNGSSY